jgi:hypothetical protein
MSQYLDKDFLKFLLGFVAIIFISLIVVATLRGLEDGKTKSVPETVQTAATTQP